MPSPPAIANNQLKAVINMWDPKPNEGLRGQVDQILTLEKSLFSMHDSVLAINQMSPMLLTVTDDPELALRTVLDGSARVNGRSPAAPGKHDAQ